MEESALKQFFEVSISELPVDEIEVVLRKLDPEDLLELCKISEQFGSFCNDNQLWTDLQ